ncbi:structural maintenance of chromosomes protein 6 [Thrips palmi]|uniref:Structural maintenance of chromosomes protein 6 n=1 Tax=Thrips palmi TaxID=161013 RepID=A0A6P8Y8N4_THRPL|nr:structural maintenance of chromosomes protein 6 [Thrips palmi]XP_034236000.1 structural maintenance of chromosomes protein 6 [Thrips palmi]
MSLENSQYTFHTLQSANQNAFRKEVDRITKEADHVESSDEETPQSTNAPSQAKRGRFSQSQDGSQRRNHCPSRAISGVVLEVHLDNFLCHDSYKVVLNKEINFIVGRNGSGKSAILTGLVVALGGSASTTGRGAALKDFVKHGCPTARVKCIISNAGALNYHRDLYGDKIQVVRTIQSQGGSSVKLLSENGKLVSSKMDDLKSMTLHLGIQVDNPISVLDQNTARHFLNMSKPSNKFDLFMRATNLETLQKIYIDIALSVDRTHQEIKKKERELVDNNAEVIEIKRKYDMLQGLEADRANENILKMELLWAEARDYGSALARAEKDLQKAVREKEQLSNTLSSEEQSETILQEIESAKAEVDKLKELRKEVEDNLKELRTKMQTINQQQRKIAQERQAIENQIKSDKTTLDAYKAEIVSQERKLLPEHIDRRRKQREEIHELQGRMQQLEENQGAKQAEVKALQAKAVGINDTLDQLKRNQRRLDSDLRSLTTNLQGLESNESNLSLFGPCIPELVRQIELNNRFKKKPVGPLGSYVKVMDSKWTLAIESVIGGRMNTFVVDNLDDEKLLRNLIQRICTRGRQPGIIRTSFPTTVYDTSRRAARTSEYGNILDVVEISNVVAHNILIELCSLESTMLIPTDDECYRLLSNLTSVPRNCGRAYTLNADSYFPAPNYRTYSSNQRSAAFLQSSRDSVIRETKQKIQDAQGMLQEVNQKMASARNELETVDREVMQKRSAMQNLGRVIMETKRKLDELKDAEQPDTHSISELKEELAELERRQEEKLNKLNEFPSKIDALKKEGKETEKSGSVLKQKFKDFTEQMEAHIQKKTACTERLEEIKSAQSNKKRKLEQVKKKEEQCTTECKELEDKLNEKKLAAEKYEEHLRSEALEKGLEIESKSGTDRKIKVIDQELRNLSKRLASIEKTLGQDAESTEKEYHEKLGAYNTTKKRITDLKSNAAIMKHALDQRKSLYHTQKSLMCAVVSHQFTRVLRYRNCTGNVKVNFERRSLDISVGPIDEGERAGLGTSSLSGGERSYATMAFVIALWNVTELPFYYLDEFDVFMDMLNRQTVLTLLLRFAKQKRGYQFGFLTPLDTTAVSSSSKVSIFKLNDPRP